jgi:hypothetical protein
MDTERVLEDHTVIVRNGFITSLGPSATITVPPDADKSTQRELAELVKAGLLPFEVLAPRAERM